MGTNSEKFCLRWNDFESNISVAFREIREEKDFFDCTLSCGARQIQAHKLILSACSPFFRSILRQNPHQHPLLYLKGVEFTDLQAVLNFMYHGEVNVAQEELNSFLSVAEDLKVKGLTQNNTPESHPSKPKPKSEPEAGPAITRPSVQRSVPVHQTQPTTSPAVTKPRQRQAVAPPVPHAPSPQYQDQNDDDIQEVVPVVKQEPAAAEHSLATMAQYPYQETMDIHQGTAVASMEESYGDDSYEDYGGYEGEGYEEDGSMMTSGAKADPNKGVLLQGASQLCQKHDEKNYECLSCGKMFSDQSNCKRHIRTNHLGEDKNATCPHCNKVELKTNMKRHLKKYCVNSHLYVEEAQHAQYY